MSKLTAELKTPGSRMRVLLTGGNGMVGRNLKDHPAIDNFDVLAPSSHELDLLDFGCVRDYISNCKPDLIVHAAGHVGGIQNNIEEPVRFLTENLDMGRNITLSARNGGVRRLLNLGSSCMYPRNAPNPLEESMILTGELEPTNEGYALAKIVTARLCEYISRESRECEYKTIIPCNIYGPYDKFDPGQSHLVPAIIHKLHRAKILEENSVEIWGDGTARREFMYAADLAEFLIKALLNFDKLPAMTNVGVGIDHTIDEYYKTAARVIGYKGKFTHNPDKPSGMQQKLVSTEKAKKFGWQAKTTLRDGMEKTYRYYLDRHGSPT